MENRTKVFRQIIELRDKSEKFFGGFLKGDQSSNFSNDKSKLIYCFLEWQKLLKEIVKMENVDISDITNTRDFLEQVEKRLRKAGTPLSHDIRNSLGKAAKCISLLPTSGDIDLMKNGYYLAIKLAYNYLLVEMYCKQVEEEDTEYTDDMLKGLNANILLSCMDYFSDYYSNTLYAFSNMFMPMKKCDAHVFFVLGKLNFRCHNYNRAIGFLSRAKRAFEEELGANIYGKGNLQDEYFETCILLAYCNEYDHSFEKAIKILIGMDIIDFIEKYKNKSNLYNIIPDPFDREQEHINNLENFITGEILNCNNGLLDIANQRDVDPARKGNMQAGIWGDKHEILHSFAHCCNELAMKLLSDNTGDSPKNISPQDLIQIARNIMLFVAEYNHEKCIDFQTCLYMIYGEAKDWGICLEKIEMESSDDNFLNRSISFQMEHYFYKYFVTRQVYVNPQKDKAKLKEAMKTYEKFKMLANSRYDHDSLIYIEIFHFRFEIVEILRFNSKKDVLRKLKELRETPAGKELFGHKPSTKMNKWIHREYTKTKAIYEFLIIYHVTSENESISKIFNYAERFNFLLQDEKMFDECKNENEGEKDKILRINKIISNMIIDFKSPQSIFILAPVSSAIPYQYQSGAIIGLEEELWSDMKGDCIEVNKLEKVNKLIPPKSDLSMYKSLFSYRAFEISFIATKRGSMETNNSYFLLKKKEGNEDISIYERPIIDEDEINKLLRELKEFPSVEGHPMADCTYANITADICLTKYFGVNDNDNDNRKGIFMLRELCRKLMLADIWHKNMHFIFRYLYDENAVDLKNWCIVALRKELSYFHIKEIRNILCSKPETKLRVIDDGDYCFVSHSSTDLGLVENDLWILEKDHKIRFWYDQLIPAGKDWNHDIVFPKMERAKCFVFYVSEEALKGKGFFQEVKYFYDLSKKQNITKKIIIPIFKDKSKLTEAINSIRNTKYDNITIDGKTYPKIHKYYEKIFLAENDTHAYRMPEPNIKCHLDKIIPTLKDWGVVDE